MYICSPCSSGQILFSCKFSFLLVKYGFYSATNIDRAILRKQSVSCRQPFAKWNANSMGGCRRLPH